MDHICLYCYSSSTVASNCGVCGRARTPIKVWPDHAAGQTLISIRDFNPSCRHVAFDCHVNQAQAEVYVVVRVKMTYQDFAGVSNGAGGWTYPPLQWTALKKADFLKRFQASVGLWDGHQQLHHNGVAYTPLFFVEPVSTTPQVEVIVEASSDQVELLPMSTEHRLWTASVSLLPPYPTSRPVASKGTRPAVKLRTKAVATRSCLKNTALIAGHADQSHYNPMAHEYGHLLGLPDEYNWYSYNPAAPPPASTQQQDGEGRPLIFWLNMVQGAGLQAPALGQYGHGHHQVAEHNIMRDVHASPGGFLDRHYLTVLEALNHLTAHNTTLVAGGAWTL